MNTPAPAEAESPPDHQILMMASVPLVWDGIRWRLADERPELYRDDEAIVCTQQGHVMSGVERARCDIEKEKARAAGMPSARAVAEAFAGGADATFRL